MSEKEIASHVESADDSIGHDLYPEKTNNTVGSGWEETEADEDFRFTFSKGVAFFAIILGFWSDVFVGAAASAVLTNINADLGASKSYVWMVSATYLTVSLTSPFIGRLGDIFGRRNLLLFGNFICIIGNLISALAHSVNTIIAGAVLIGVGSSMHQLGWACVGEIVPKKHRPTSMSVLESSISPGAFLGPLIAFSLLRQTALQWRNIYWICVATNGGALILILLFYHPVNQYIKEKGKTRWDQVKSLDYIGFLLFAIGLCLFLIGLSFGGTTFPWKSAGTLAPICIGVVFLVLTGIYENHIDNPYAIFPHALMRNFRGFSIVMGVTFMLGMLYYSTLILWPLQIQTFYATSSTKIGLYSMAFSLGGCISALLFAPFFERVDQGRWILTGISILGTALVGCSATVGINTNISSTVITVLMGAVVSCATVASNSMVQLGVPHQYLGVAMGLVTTARNVGGSISTTIYTVILTNHLNSHLGVNVATALAKAGVPLADLIGVTEAIATGNTTSPALASASPAALGAGVLALKLTYRDAFKLIFLVSIAFGVVGTVCAAFSQNVGKFMTNKVDVRLDSNVHVGHEVHQGGHVIQHDGTEITKKKSRQAAVQQDVV